MSRDERFYDKVGKVNGWDFGDLNVFSEGVEWDFVQEVKSRCNQADVLLDLGTGGGENLLKLSPSLLLAIGIDLSNEMIQTAKTNLKNSSVSNIRFFQMPAEALQFPDGLFDVVTSRHAPFSSKEVFRVLKAGGLFMTQQVSEFDKLNIKKAFGRGQSLEEKDGTLKERFIHELREAGFSNVQAFEYDATEYYERPEDLLFLLKHTPIVPDFGRDQNDFNTLNDFIKTNTTDKGIRTNSKRFLIIAKK
ncbi:putative methyltransferase ycgJ [Bhargavaea cecembensis DSE10]|uniref:Putative methyltransferase ycgJ n=1 Tax=Bhargavaea cecembensis DSE10 TaxID=1235279 RepID=M7NZZ7_9BACL|nr:class I SAM-dependent methyltransferase [Bhargavaea cecembensis]EMR07240.1 putative methyltransferase ycgJ [Bhargavaea cecembensis DSE10]